MRNALKAVGAALAVIALCAPLIFWPTDDAQTVSTELSQATVTVPPTVVVSTTLPPGATTSTTEVSPEPSSTTTTEPLVDITIAAVGDAIPHESLLNSVKGSLGESYDFRPVFAPVAPYLRRADYAVANLETPLAGPGASYNGYPLFNSPVSLAYALKYSGVDLVSTANNHSLDMGWEGVVGTLDALDSIGLAHVGTHRSSQEKVIPFLASVQGIKVAFLNYTASTNGLSPPEEQADFAVDLLDVDAVAQDAAIARMWGADVVIALLHFGTEYERIPSEAQREIAKEVLSRGVDVILGTHPHVVQPIEHVFEYDNRRVNDRYIVYSLGNFISDQRMQYRDSGLIAYIHIEKRGLRTTVTGVSYLPVYVQRSTEQVPVRYRVLPVLPWSMPQSDAPITTADSERMTQVWEELRDMLYRPDEQIKPLNPAELRP